MISDNEVAVDVEPADRNIAEKIRNRIQSLPSLESCIYRVPEKFRIGKEEVYMPKIIAIGPYHCNNPKLKDMEEHKQRYLQAFLTRSSKQLEEVVNSIRVLQQDALDCYADPINDMSTDDFIIMMLDDGCFILELLCRYFDEVRTNRRTKPKLECTKGKHLLDFLRTHLLPSSQQVEFRSYANWEYTKCVTDISEAEVKFKRRAHGDGLLDVKFENGVLEIPPFCFGESVTVLLPNLIALEQCQGYTDQITSYVILLDSLINSPNDVKLLRNRDIIDSLFHEDEKVAIAISNLCKGVVVNEFYYDLLCHRVNAYCRTDWHKWRATLKRDYFNTPWAILSFNSLLPLYCLFLLSYSPSSLSLLTMLRRIIKSYTMIWG
ncbi:hypothetical protein Sjap_016459 [Stephania japonica]|uniref:Uncharacterized protein n=1 Tax=Stephania japonica TaxID=461633 RepID=A0AAP0IN16_9MAGN